MRIQSPSGFLNSMLRGRNRRLTKRKTAEHRPAEIEHLEQRALLSFQSLGPGAATLGQVENVSPNDEVSGAIHTVIAHPSDANILYAGGTNGGVWRTDNALDPTPEWRPLTDSQASNSIGALAFDTSDPTGDTVLAGIGRYSSFGQAGGDRIGVLKTTDGGLNWSLIDGGGILQGANISGIAANGNNIVVSVNIDDDFSFGQIGIFHSSDGGTTFTTVADGNGSVTGLPGGVSYDLAVDPTNPDVMYTSVVFADIVGGQNGVYKSVNGGANWSKVSNAAMDSYITNATSNLEIAVGHANNVFVGVLQSGAPAGLFSSPDGGGTWNQMDLPSMPVVGLSGTGINDASNTSPIVINSPGHGLFNNAFVNISGVAGNTAANGVFQVTLIDGDNFELDFTTGNGSYSGGGTALRVLSLNPKGAKGPQAGAPDEIAGGQGSIHFSIAADPNDPNIVYVGGDRQDNPGNNFIGANNFSGNLWRGNASVAATGATPSPQWAHLTHSNNVAAIPNGGTASGSSPHADSREITIDANGDLIETDDGGIYRRTSPRDNTGDWFSINGNIATTEQHDVAYDTISNIVISGNQDTGTTQQTASVGTTEWESVSQADGGDVAVSVDPGNPAQSVRYSSFQNLGAFVRRTYDAGNNLVGVSGVGLNETSGSYTPTFVTPVEVNAVDPNRILIGGGNDAWISLDQGDTITPLGIGGGVNDDAVVFGAAGNVDSIYIGSGSTLFMTTTAAPPVAAAGYTGGFIRDIAVASFGGIYVVDDTTLWESTDGGASFIDVTAFSATTLSSLGGDANIRSVEVVEPGGGSFAVVIGSDQGVFEINDVTGTWSELGAGILPNVPVHDLDYDAADDVLVVGTLGRGAWMVHHASSEIFGGAATDLRAWVVDAGDAPVAAGQTLNVDFEYDNIGTTFVDAADFDVSFYLSRDDLFDPSDVLLTGGTNLGTSLNPSESAPGTQFVDLPPTGDAYWQANGNGTYFIGMVVDDGGTLAEANETNNIVFGAVEVTNTLGVAGTVAFNAAGYQENDTAVITVFDADLTGPAVNVVVISSAGDSETVTLNEVGPGTYEGTTPLMAIPVVVGNAVTDVSLGDQIAVLYNDANDGSGGPALATDVADIVQAFTFTSDFSDNLGNPALDGFNVDNTGGDVAGLWHLSQGRGGDAGHSGADSFYFGQGESAAGGGNYDVGDTAGRITSSSMDLRGLAAASLSFNHFLDAESGGFDIARVRISQDFGAFVDLPGAENLANTGGAFVPMSFDLSPYIGTTIQVQFDFDTVDGLANAQEGWYVDDVVVTALQAANQLVGVDFDGSGGNAPNNWTTFGTTGTVTDVLLPDLIDESGTPSGIDLTVTNSASVFSDSGTPGGTQLPIHTQALDDIANNLFGDNWTLTWSNLTPGANYEVYLFGLDGISTTSDVTITGGGAPITFQQSFGGNDLDVNDEDGDSGRLLGSFAEVVEADGSGLIVVDVVDTAGDAGLGGVAIREVFSPPGPVDDHGSDFSTATPIVPGTVSGNIEVSGDHDYFAFNAVAGSLYILETTLLGLPDSFLELYDQDGTTLITADDDGAGSLASRITFEAPASGTYFVNVRDLGSGTGAYELELTELAGTLTVTIAEDSILENAGINAANVTVTRTGDTSGALVVDLVSSDTTEAVTFPTPQVTIPAGQASTTFVIDAVDDAILDGTQTVTITATAPSYVEGADTIDVLDDEPDDHGNDFATATPIVPGTVSGNIEVDGDVDFFAFDAVAGNTYVLETTLLGLPDSFLTLYDTNGTTVIDSDDDGAGGLASLITFLPSVTGTYFAEVRNLDFSGTGAYELELSETSSTESLTVTITAEAILEGAGIDATTATVTRTGDTTNALVVNLSSDDTTEATVPTTVTIPAGQTSAVFDIAAVDDAIVDGTQNVTITASATGFADGVDSVDVEDDDGGAALSVTIAATAFVENAGAGATSATVSRSGNTANALVVTLISSDTTEAVVPATITIPAGQASATFDIDAVDDAIVDGTQTVTVTATAGGLTDGTDTVDVLDDGELPPGGAVLLLDIAGVGSGPGVTLAKQQTYTVTVSVVGSPADILSYQLQFEDSDVSLGGLQLTNWVNNSGAFNLPVDPNLDTSANDGLVAAAAFATSSVPVELGTFDLTTPDVVATTTFLLSANSGTGSNDDTILSNAGGMEIPVSDYGDINVTVAVDAVPPTVTSIGLNTDQVDPADLPGGPQPANWLDQRSEIRSVVVTLSEDVATINPSDLVLTNLGVNAPVDGDAVVPIQASQLSQAGNVLTITFPNSGPNSLADGVYRLDVLDSVTDLAGNPLDGDNNGSPGGTHVFQGNTTNEFSVLTGDWNGSGGVNILDFATFSYWFNQNLPIAPGYVDGNDSGGVNILDFAGFSNNFNASLTYPAPLGPLSSSASTLNTGAETILGFVPDVGVVTMEGLNTVITVDPGTSIGFTASLDSATQLATSYQLNFENSDPALAFSSWANNGSAFGFPVDGIIEDDLFVASAGFTQHDTPPGLDLGTFSVLAPAAGGDYLLTANSVTSANDDTLISNASGLPISIDDFGDVIIRVPGGNSALSVSILDDEISENGGTTTATVTRDSSTAADLLVTLSSNDTGEAIVPDTVTIPAGQTTSAPFTITGVDDAIVDGTQTVTVTASAAAHDDGTDSVDVTDDDAALTVSIVGSEISENGGTTTATVTRNSDVTRELVVTLSSNDTGEATVPATVTIPAGQTTSAPFTITGVDDAIVDGTQTVTVTASVAEHNDGTDTVDVTDDDAALTVSIVDDSISENGGATTATVTRDSSTAADLVVTLSSNDTSEATVPASVTIPAGQTTSAPFAISGVDDLIVDGTQTVTVTASAASHSDGTDSVDVTDDDAGLTVTIADDSISENGGATTATVTRNSDTSRDLVVMLSSNDTSEATVPASVTIPAGQTTSAPFTITGVDDAIVDGTQTVTVTASVADHNDGTDTVDVTDDDAALTVSIVGSEISENGGTTTATVTRNSDVTQELVVTLSSNDTGEATVPATVTIPAGQTTSAPFTITGVDDAIVDGTQTVTVTASVADHNDGTDTVDVTDDDAALTVSIVDASISENGGVTTATVTRNSDTSRDLVVTLSSNDTSEATVPASVTIPAGQTTSAPFAISGVDDLIVDGTQTVTVTASAASHSDGTDSVDVTDDDAGLTVTIADDSISENGGATTATVTRNSDTSRDLVVMLSSNDTSEATVPASVTIPAGQTTSASFAISGVDDLIVDGTQTVTVTASAASHADGTDSVDVTDDDAVIPTVDLSLSVNSGSESAETMVTVTATASSAVSGVQTVDLMVTGTNVTSGDFNLSAAQITIQDGSDTGTVTFTILDDALVEALTETATLTISNPSSGIQLGTVTSQDVQIVDNDSAVVSVSAESKAEGTGAAPTIFTFTIDLSAPVDIPVGLVANTVDGSATSTSDYVPAFGVGLTFNANDTTSQSISVDVVADSDVEPDEAFDLVLSELFAPDRAVTFELAAATATATANILNDDSPPVSGTATIIDDGDDGYSTSGNWTRVNRNGHNGDFEFATSGNGNNEASWLFGELTPGQYRVSISYRAWVNRATDAPFTVRDGAIPLATLLVDQTVDASDRVDEGTNYHDLGVFEIGSGQLEVLLTNAANGLVSADSVRIERVDVETSGPQINVLLDGLLIEDDIGVVDFGSVEIGATSIRTLTIKNVGDADLTLSSLSLPTGFSLASSAPASPIAPGASTTIEIQIDTSAIAEVSGELSFDTNDTDDSPFNITLTGEVVSGIRIVDNGDNGFSTVGNWNRIGRNGHQGDFAYSAAGNGSDVARFTFNVAAGGTYRVSAAWRAHSNRATDTPFRVLDGSTELLAVDVNQQVAPNADVVAGPSIFDRFQDLGTVTVTGGQMIIEVSDDANGVVIADAIRIERIS